MECHDPYAIFSMISCSMHSAISIVLHWSSTCKVARALNNVVASKYAARGSVDGLC